MPYHVYILSSGKNGTLYIGITNNLTRRVDEHQSNIHQGFTSKYNVHQLVYYESFNNVDDAITREKQLKKWSRQRKLRLINTLNPTWSNLSNSLNN